MENASKNGRPKLELKVNQPIRVKLLKDKPFEGNSAYGSYLLYSLDVEGVEKAFFATPDVNQQISDLGLRAGDEMILRKVAVQNGRRIVANIEVEPIKKERPESPIPDHQKSGDNLRLVMEQCLLDAIEITRSVQGVPFQTPDIQKLASCLFIART